MTAIAQTPVRHIVAAISDAAERWADADFPARVRAIDGIAQRTGYSVPVVEYALDRIFFSLTKPALEATIANELGSLDALDGFTQRNRRPDAHAAPVGRVCIISSRTTIGVAILPSIFALCAKCDVVVKDREDGLIRAFFSTLHEELDALEGAAVACEWKGSDEERLEEYDAIVAFGSDETLARIRERTAYAARFAGFGSKASIGYFGRDALVQNTLHDLCDAAARDVVLYETEGCMSLHVLFVENSQGVNAGDAASALAAAIQRAAVEFPPGRRDASASARILNARNLSAFRACAGKGATFSDARASFLVVLDPPADEPPIFAPRAIAVRGVADPAQARAYVREHRLPVEAVAIAGTRCDIVNMALDMGANRITAFGELQRPPLEGGHGGRTRVVDFVRWVTREV